MTVLFVCQPLRCAPFIPTDSGGLNAVGGKRGASALHVCASHGQGNSELFQLLMSLKADCNTLDATGNSPLHAAICAHDTVKHALESAVAIIACKRAKLNAVTTSSRDTALTLASARHLPDIMAELVRAGADVNLANNAGDTAMHLACRPVAGPGDKQQWSKQPAEVLLSSKALKLDAVNAKGQTALLVLASSARWWEGAVPVAAAMVSNRSCALNVLDHAGLTALHYALGAGASFGSLFGLGHGPAIALHIINHPGSDVNIISKDRATEAAIHRCSQQGLPDVCKALIKRNADVNVANSSGYMPLHLAVSSGSSPGELWLANLRCPCDCCPFWSR